MSGPRGASDSDNGRAHSDRNGKVSVAKKKQRLWFGFLEAGTRSSAVVRDDSLDTGRAWTIYLFNLAKGRILEYHREIVEPKLRPLDAGESDLVGELSAAYREARESFVPRATVQQKTVRQPRKRPVELELPDFDGEGEGLLAPLDDDYFGQLSVEYPD